MKTQLYQSRLKRLLRQRLNAVVLIIALFMLNVMQAMALFPLLDHQKVILVPANLQHKAWVSDEDVSPSYVISMTRLLCDLRFNLTLSTIKQQADALLQYVHPTYYGTLKHQLADEAAKLKKEHFSSVFYPVDMQLQSNGRTKRVRVTGDLSVWLDQHAIMTSRKHYQFEYLYRNGQLQLIGLHEIKHHDNHDEDNDEEAS